MKEVNWWRTTFGEEEKRRIGAAIDGEHISQGQVTAAFEQALGELLGVPHVVATTSGSMAILMALMALGVGPGDEVIVPNRTWIATAHAPHLLGAKVRLVDVLPDLPIMDVSLVEAAITSRTRAIIPVHLNGRSSDLAALNALAARNGIPVVEDAAQALASRNADGFLGTQATMGCFSLSVAKIIATGQGGFTVTRDEAIYKRLLALRTHGVSDVIHAQWTSPGFNFRFNDILASVGLAQLGRLEGRIERVRAIYQRYQRALSRMDFIRLLPVDLDAGEIPIYIETLVPRREELMAFLSARGIQTRPFYPDLNQAAYFENHQAFPRSEHFGKQGLFLPSGPEQPMAAIETVLEALGQFGQNTEGGGHSRQS